VTGYGAICACQWRPSLSHASLEASHLLRACCVRAPCRSPTLDQPGPAPPKVCATLPRWMPWMDRACTHVLSFRMDGFSSLFLLDIGLDVGLFVLKLMLRFGVCLLKQILF
jgi:hypothetical protein